MEQLQIIPINKLVESKTNPRQTFDEISLKELAESIRKQGLKDSIKVRQVGDKYEIIDGARRFRACKMITGDPISCLVHNMSDVEVIETQMICFLQRKDLGPIEEAEGFAQLQKKSKFDIAMIAEKTGKDRSYVAKRLQLVKLIPPVRQLLQGEKISLAAAIAIARLPEDLQKECAKWVGDHLRWNSEFLNEKDVSEFIEEEIYLNLSSAAFKLSDQKLVPKAGACTVCPKNTQTSPDLFGDMKKGSRCLDKACFALKSQALITLKEKEAEDAGKPLLKLSTDHNHPPKGAIGTSDYRETTAKAANAVGIIMDGVRAGQIVHIKINKADQERVEARSQGHLSDAERKERYEKRMEIFGNKIEAETRVRLLPEILSRIKSVDKEDLVVIARWITGSGDFNLTVNFDKDILFKAIGIKGLTGLDSMNSHQLMRLIVGAFLMYEEFVNDPSYAGSDGESFTYFAKRYGIDQKAIAKAVTIDLEPMKPKPFKLMEKPKKPAKATKTKKSGKKKK